MNRALVLAVLLALSSGIASGQGLVVLHVTVTLTDASGAKTPVPRHALLISDNPSSSPPRRLLTKLDGTLDVSLRPGSYTIESDEPVAFAGKGYQWAQIIDVAAGRPATLALTSENAEVGEAPAGAPLEPTSAIAPASRTSLENSPSLLLATWQGSLVSIWSPESHATGFLVDAAGLVLTNQRSIGTATSIEVQLSPTLKVPARAVATDIARDAAVLWIDPAAVEKITPMPLDCGDADKLHLADRQSIMALTLPMRGSKDVTEGVMAGTTAASLRLSPGGGGGPVLNVEGAIVGLTSIIEQQEGRRRRDEVRVVPLSTMCDAVESAIKAMATVPKPLTTRLPVEPPPPSAGAAAPTATSKRTNIQMSLYQTETANDEVTFITPVMIESSRNNQGWTGTAQDKLTMATDFDKWSDYFADVPPVLVIRVTPKLTESMWTTIGRMAAATQGANIPPIKHFRPGFGRMQAFCGDQEVTPIHPFTVVRRVSETDAIREGLYVFDPRAFSPECKSVKVVIFSEKEPNKPDAKVIDAQLIDHASKDFSR